MPTAPPAPGTDAFRVLSAIINEPHRSDIALARSLSLSRGGVRGILSRLLAAGMVDRDTGFDRRANAWTVTDAGMDYMMEHV